MRWDEERGRTLRESNSAIFFLQPYSIQSCTQGTQQKLTQSRSLVPEPEGEDEQEAKKNAWLSLWTDNRDTGRKRIWLAACATHRRTTSYYRIRITTDLRFRPRSSRGPGRTGRLRSSSMPEHPNPWRSQPPPFDGGGKIRFAELLCSARC
jgi:hypothetical protein